MINCLLGLDRTTAPGFSEGKRERKESERERGKREKKTERERERKLDESVCRDWIEEC